MYTDIEEGFMRTKIPVKETCLTGEPVARSQARRICNRLDAFKDSRGQMPENVRMPERR